MRGMARFEAIGTVVADPDYATLQSGTARLRVRMVCNEQEKRGDKWEEVATFFDTVFWGKRAEGLSKVLRKGVNLYFSGQFRNYSYEDKEGVKRYTYQFKVDPTSVVLLPSGQRNRGDQPPDEPPPDEPSSGDRRGGDDGPPRGGTVEDAAREMLPDDDLPF